MAYKVIILYRLYMPSYFLGTFTEYPELVGFFVSLDIPPKIRFSSQNGGNIPTKRFSDRYLVEHLNGNIHYQMFCGVMIDPNHKTAKNERTNCPIRPFILCKTNVHFI